MPKESQDIQFFTNLIEKNDPECSCFAKLDAETGVITLDVWNCNNYRNTAIFDILLKRGGKFSPGTSSWSNSFSIIISYKSLESTIDSGELSDYCHPDYPNPNKEINNTYLKLSKGHISFDQMFFGSTGLKPNDNSHATLQVSLSSAFVGFKK